MSQQYPSLPSEPVGGTPQPAPTSAYPHAPTYPYPAPPATPHGVNPQAPFGTHPPAPGAHGLVTQPSGPRAARPWYKKKRFVIPGGVVLLAIIGGIAGGGQDDGDIPSAAATQETDVAVVKEKTAEEVAAEEQAAEEAAAAEEARRAEEEARKAEEERLAEEQRVAEEAAAAAAAAAEAARIGSVAQQNAYRTAEDYLGFTAFSRSGLIDQLEFEGYSTADAEFGVARIEAEGGVDWNAQAAESAADYLSFTSFSRSGLIDQLVFEGYSREQAEYGVSTTGL